MKLSSLLKTSGLFVAAFSFIQCSSSSSNPVAGKPGDSGTSPDCQTYCDNITANCTGGDTLSTSNQQYSTKANCLEVCKAFPVGTAADKAGNTLGCRSYHATLAAGSTNAATHCPHAGPSGDGVCGDVCVSYCQIAEMFCTGSSKIYTNNADCLATCNATPVGARFNISIQASNERACLVYHAQESPLDPASHCTGDLMKQADAGTTGGGSVTCH